MLKDAPMETISKLIAKASRAINQMRINALSDRLGRYGQVIESPVCLGKDEIRYDHTSGATKALQIDMPNGLSVFLTPSDYLTCPVFIHTSVDKEKLGLCYTRIPAIYAALPRPVDGERLPRMVSSHFDCIGKNLSALPVMLKQIQEIDLSTFKPIKAQGGMSQQ